MTGMRRSLLASKGHLLKFFFQLTIACSIAAFQACEKPSENLSGIKVIGHTGTGFRSLNNNQSPNTVESVKKGLVTYQADGIEVDVQMSKDSVLYMYHDLKLNTQTNFDGCIYNYTSQELEACTYRHGGEKLAKLSEILLWLNDRNGNSEIFLDMRTNQACIEAMENIKYLNMLARSLARTVKDLKIKDKITVETGNHEFAGIVKGILPELAYDMDCSPSTLDTLEPGGNWKGVVLMHNEVTKETIEKVKRLGLHVTLFGMQTRNDFKEAINKQPDYLQTDNIPLTQELLSE
jgi:glycerophosphoryl diester phosphodiesterase